jgi:hypothetical protein
MRKDLKMPNRKKFIHLYLVISAITFLISCTQQHSQILTGKWQEIGKKATLEFYEDNTFKAIDDMGMAVNGKYAVDHNGNFRFEVKHGDGETEIIGANVVFEKEDLIFNFGDTNGVEKYRRIKP